MADCAAVGVAMYWQHHAKKTDKWEDYPADSAANLSMCYNMGQVTHTRRHIYIHTYTDT